MSQKSTDVVAERSRALARDPDFNPSFAYEEHNRNGDLITYYKDNKTGKTVYFRTKGKASIE